MENKCISKGSKSKAVAKATNHEQRRVTIVFLVKREVSKVAEYMRIIIKQQKCGCLSKVRSSDNALRMKYGKRSKTLYKSKVSRKKIKARDKPERNFAQ